MGRCTRRRGELSSPSEPGKARLGLSSLQARRRRRGQHGVEGGRCRYTTSSRYGRRRPLVVIRGEKVISASSACTPKYFRRMHPRRNTHPPPSRTMPGRLESSGSMTSCVLYCVRRRHAGHVAAVRDMLKWKTSTGRKIITERAHVCFLRIQRSAAVIRRCHFLERNDGHIRRLATGRNARGSSCMQSWAPESIQRNAWGDVLVIPTITNASAWAHHGNRTGPPTEGRAGVHSPRGRPPSLVWAPWRTRSRAKQAGGWSGAGSAKISA